MAGEGEFDEVIDSDYKSVRVAETHLIRLLGLHDQ